MAQIITYSTLSAKSVVDEVLKSAGVPLSIIQTVKETIPSDPEITIADLKENERFMKAMMAIPFPNIQFQVTSANAHKIKSFDNIDSKYWDAIREIQGGKTNTITIEVQSSWNYEKAIHIMSRLEKLSKHESVHSGGVVVSPVTLEDNIPLMKKKEDTSLASQYDMVMLEYLGYLKMDALGLRTVDVIHDAERLVRKWYDPNFNIRKIPYNDKNAIDLIHRGDTIGIFQIESSGFTQMMRDIFDASDWNRQQKNMIEQIEGMDIEIEDFMWIVAGLAMYRPGPLDAVVEGKTMVQHIIDRKAGKEPVIYLFPEEAQYLGDTYGVMIYQEQVMSRVRQMTGCTYGRADMLRRAMGKKDPVEMKKQMEWFEEHASKHDFTSQPMNDMQRKNIIQRAIDEIDKFARYGLTCSPCKTA